MKQEAKILLGVGAVAIAILVGAVVLLSGNTSTPITSTTKADPKILFRSDSDKLGSASAKVTLVEFSDYQCPACGAAYPIIKQIINDYKDKVLFVYRNFPLSIHQNSKIAAEAAEAAGAQGKYWQMHDMLFENQSAWSSSSNPLDMFTEYAKSIGLDTDKFKNDVEGNKYSDKIKADINDGVSLGVNSTPTFYLNGEKVTGLASFNDLKSKIDALLK